ncbi:hypothetical protein LCGC14_1576940, partial [marine sediment metagenome]
TEEYSNPKKKEGIIYSIPSLIPETIIKVNEQ